MTPFTPSTARPVRAALSRAVAAALPALALPLLALSAPPAAAAEGNGVADAVTALRAITTLQADFVQTDRRGRSMHGILTLKQPGKIRFQYDKGANMLVVSNGRTLTMIDYDVNDLKRYPIGNSPLGALLNPTKDVTRYGRVLPTTNPAVLSAEFKDPSKPEYPTLTMIFVRKPGAPGGLELNSWVALDAQNQRTTVRLSNQRYGVPVADSAFTYVEPSPRLGPHH